MKMIKFYNCAFIITLFVILTSCGGAGYKKSPLDEIVRDLPSEKVFTIILHDMDAQGNFMTTYYHKYRIVREFSPVDEVTTEWHEVSRDEFERYVNDMGMEIAARDSTGKLSKTVAPPGYHNYVGNPKYGQWENRGGSSFWAFYGQYAFMTSMFRMAAYPAHRGYYDNWRGNYYGTNRRYYGPSGAGGSYYGTNSAYNRASNPNSNWGSKSNSFKNRVAGRTSRSSSRTRSSSGSRARGGGSGK